MRISDLMLRPALMGWLGMILVATGLVLAGCNQEDITSVPESRTGLRSGVLTDLPESALTAGGWQLCHSETYSTTTTTLSTVLSNCAGSHLMLACREATATVLTVAAYAPSADVTFLTQADTTSVHNANNTAWYYNPAQAWGFAVQGDAVYKNDCDYEPSAGSANPGKKLCWHLWTTTIGDGWRCGATESLNGATNWLKLIYRFG